MSRIRRTLMGLALILPLGAAMELPPNYVAVTPDGGALSTPAGSTAQAAIFTIQNTYSMEDSYDLACSVSGQVTSCSVAPMATVAGASSAQVTVSYNTGTQGSGSVTLSATSQELVLTADNGSYNVTVTAVPVSGVTVTTVSGPATLGVEESGTFTFDVRNTGTASALYALACSSAGPVAMQCEGVSPSSATLAAQQILRVSVFASAGTSTGSAGVTLTASGPATSSATRTLTVTRPSPVAIMTPYGDQMNRALCPTVGAGAGSAVQCGDLLYAHGLPAYRSLNEARGLTMLYSSATARPTPVLALDYTTFANDPVPQMLKVEVWRDAPSTLLATVYFSTAGFQNLSRVAHRLVVPLDHDSARATGAHAIHYAVSQKLNGVWGQPVFTAQARLLVVNRAQSAFGAGWWPAGVERLYMNQSQLGGAAGTGAMLELADGSALFYDRTGAGAFRSPPNDYSLLEQLADGRFRRTLAGNRVRVTYSAVGLVESVEDINPSPNVGRYYSTGTRLDSIVDPTGKAVGLAYPAGATTLTLPGINAVTLTRDGAGDVTSITDPDGFVTRFTYQAVTHRMATSHARGTSSYRYTYDQLGFVDSAVAPVGASKRFTAWQRTGAPATGTGLSEALPAAPSSPYDAQVRVSWTRYPRPTQLPVEDAATFAVDRFGAVVRSSPPAIGTTTVERDSLGRAVHILTPSQGDIRQEYDADGYLVRVITAHAPATTTRDTLIRYDTTRYDYDRRWRAVSTIVNPERDSVRIAYDVYGRRITSTDAAGRVARFTYRTDGLLDSILAPHPDTIAHQGQQDTVATTYAYDPATRNLTAVMYGSNMTTSYGYAANGSDVDTIIDPAGMSTAYTYDAVKRVTSVTQQGGSVDPSTVSYAFNDSAYTRSQTDPLGYVSTWQADAAGRLVRRCARANWCDSTEWEDGVNPAHLKLRNGVHTDTEFDAAGRATRKLVGTRNGSSPVDTVDFAYDATGGATAIDNQYSQIRRGYNAYGQLVSERQTVKAWNATTFDGPPAIYHAYDRNGRRRATYVGSLGSWVLVCTPRPVLDGEIDPCQQPSRFIPTDSVTSRFDRAGHRDRLTSTLWQLTAGAGANSWTWAYDGQNRLTRSTVPTTSTGGTQGSIATDRTYDGRGFLRMHVLGTVLNETITADVLGRTVTYAGNQTRLYAYDGLGRLSRAEGTDQAGPETFTYDAAGNRRTDRGWSYTYNSQGQLTVKQALAGSCRLEYVHDQQGNELSQTWVPGNCSGGATRTMVYDRGNQMDSLSVVPAIDPAHRRFWYDGLGRRVLMRSDDPAMLGDWGTWRYFWADDNVLVQLRNDYVAGAADVIWPRLTRTNGVLTGDGQWFTNGAGPDQVLASWNRDQGGSRQLFHRDYRSSVYYVTDATGASTGLSGYNYLAFGNATGTSAPAAGDPGFNGASSAGGLIYQRNRWYDPNSGRFTQEDPIGFAGGINLYAYAGNDPVTYSDPYGLSSDSVSVACRYVDDTGNAGAHCAVRVDQEGGKSTTFELLSSGVGKPQTAGVQSDPKQLERYEGKWVAVKVPTGMNHKQFGATVLSTAQKISAQVNGDSYSPLGGQNSNRYVYNIITQAGGQVPFASRLSTPGATAPGLCGGRGIFQGATCSF